MEPILEEERDTTSAKTNLLYFSEVPTLTKEGDRQFVWIKSSTLSLYKGDGKICNPMIDTVVEICLHTKASEWSKTSINTG